MSKIYEALLRAEMDRIAELNRSGAAGVSSPADSNGHLAAAQTAQRTVSSPDTVALAEQDLHTAAVTHDMDLVNGEHVSASAGQLPFTPSLREWHPDEQRLQSLQPRGVLVEQVRLLRSRLNELRQDRPLKTVLISSGLPQEGKSFVAANLAVGFAKFRNRRVLMIDGDMRRGTMHKIFGTDRDPGLTDYLADRASLDTVMQRMQTPGAGPLKSLASLTLIPSGNDADNAADLSGNGRFEALLRTVYDHFDWIIVDSSPVTLVADGANLARACDGVVLVARGGVTKYEVAQRAQQELKAARIIGVVLNAVAGTPQVGGYYGYDS